ncbi:MAG: hypothetical protein KDD22_07030, partial [Bdellovibrionales bacterium]|nr:hypothetical protein [Bdellovibrionales bacterium]
MQNLKTSQPLKSTEPHYALKNWVAQFGTPQIQEILMSIEGALLPVSSSKLLKQLEDLGAFAAAQELGFFFETFGDRAFSDLKIEHLSFSQDVRMLCKIALGYCRCKSIELSRQSVMEIPGSLNALDRSLQYREECRLLRSRYLGWFRKCLLQLEEQWKAETHCAWNLPHPWVFYLQISDFEKYLDGSVNIAMLMDIARQRCDLWESFSHPMPHHLILEKGQDYKNHQLSTQKTPSLGSLEGLWVAGESVEGEILVVTDPQKISSDIYLEDKILVTTSTDPAWVFLMSQCRGLISEHGGLLSHTAIIGRELNI